MNDYWDYLSHSEVGGERKGHKYYARVLLGRNKLGFNQYRYFYDAREYGAYMTQKKAGHPLPRRWNDRKTTYYTGKGPTLPTESDKYDTYNMRSGDTKNRGSAVVDTPWQKTKRKVSRSDLMKRYTVSTVPKSKVGKKLYKTAYDFKKQVRKGKSKVERFLADYQWLLP